MNEYKNPLQDIPPLTQEEFNALPDEMGGDIYKSPLKNRICFPREGRSPWTLFNYDHWSIQVSCPDDLWQDKCSYFYGYITQWRRERATKALEPADPKQQASTEKAPLQLLPPTAMQEIAHVLKLGAHKYGEWNWRGNIDSIQDSTYHGATLRHVVAMMNGEPEDPESQRSHWAHIGATAMIMLDVLNERKK